MAIIAITTRPPDTPSNSSSRSSRSSSVAVASERIAGAGAHWLNALAATVNVLTACAQIRHFVISITVESAQPLGPSDRAVAAQPPEETARRACRHEPQPVLSVCPDGNSRGICRGFHERSSRARPDTQPHGMIQRCNLQHDPAARNSANA
jgi:hypothetical protein